MAGPGVRGWFVPMPGGRNRGWDPRARSRTRPSRSTGIHRRALPTAPARSSRVADLDPAGLAPLCDGASIASWLGPIAHAESASAAATACPCRTERRDPRSRWVRPRVGLEPTIAKQGAGAPRRGPGNNHSMRIPLLIARPNLKIPTPGNCR